MQPVSAGQLRHNGLRFYAHFDRIANASGIGIKCGSIHDPPGKRGLAHAVEHLITRRSKKYQAQEASLLLWKFLGRPDDLFNIQTTRTSTFYGHDTLLRKDQMLKVFDLMASFVRDQVVEEETKDAEWAAVHQEYLLRGIDNLEDLLEVLLHQAIYERNPARNRIDCEPEELRTASVQDARALLRKHYLPNNAFVVLLGPSFEEAKKLVRRYFNDWEPGNLPTLEYDHRDNFPALTSTKVLEVARAGIHQHHLAIGFPTETYLSKDAETLDVLARILEIRLYERLRAENRDFDKGAYRVFVETRRTFVHGLFFAHFATKNREFAEYGTATILNEIEKLKQDWVNHLELDAAISNLDNDYLDDFRNTPGRLTDRIIEAATNGDEDLVQLHGFRERLHKVGKKKIRNIANKYLSSPHIQVVISPQ